MKGLYNSKLFERTFEMEGAHKKYTIWKSYHDETQIKRYNLFENDRIYLFNTTNSGYSGVNINNLNKIICEGCCILYPYLNNLKSKIIGFQSYRRYFNSAIDALKLDDINQGKVQIFQSRKTGKYYKDDKNYNIKYIYAFNHFSYWKCIDNGFYDNFIEFITKYFPEYFDTLEKANMFYGFSLFVCNWNNYEKLCNLIWGYLNFIANKYHFNVLNDLDWAAFIEEYYIKFNRDHNIEPIKLWYDPYNYPGKDNWYTINYKDSAHFYYNLYRRFSYDIEFLVSLFANHIGNIYDSNNKIVFVNKLCA